MQDLPRPRGGPCNGTIICAAVTVSRRARANMGCGASTYAQPGVTGGRPTVEERSTGATSEPGSPPGTPPDHALLLGRPDSADVLKRLNQEAERATSADRLRKGRGGGNESTNSPRKASGQYRRPPCRVFAPVLPVSSFIPPENLYGGPDGLSLVRTPIQPKQHHLTDTTSNSERGPAGCTRTTHTKGPNEKSLRL